MISEIFFLALVLLMVALLVVLGVLIVIEVFGDLLKSLLNRFRRISSWWYALGVWTLFEASDTGDLSFPVYWVVATLLYATYWREKS